MKRWTPVAVRVRPHVALTLAMASGALAVAIVAADLQFNLAMRLEERDSSGQWTLVAGSKDNYYRAAPFGPECVGLDLRFVVDNHRPFDEAVPVSVSYSNYSAGRATFLLRDTWELEDFEVRTFPFTIPVGALGEPGRNTSYPKPPGGRTTVSASASDEYVSVCVGGPD